MPGHSYKGTASPFRSSSLNARPVAFQVTTIRITWTWNLVNPDMWGIFLASNQGIGHQLFTVVGTTRTRPGLTVGQTYVVVGLNTALNSFQTQASNPVTITF